MSEIARSTSSTEHPRLWIDELLEAHRAVLGVLDRACADTAHKPNAKGDTVHAVDLAADRAVTQCFLRDPESVVVLSEESGLTDLSQDQAGYRMVVDPIDGSDNHVRRLPLSALSVAVLPIRALLHPHAVEAAIVGPLEGGEPWLMHHARGAWRGDSVLATSEVKCVQDAFLSVELNHHEPSRALRKVLARARGVRTYGCASRALALVASGAVDAHIDLRERLTPESYLAGAALVLAAGGKVVNRDGYALAPAMRLTERVNLIAAASDALAEELARALSE